MGTIFFKKRWRAGGRALPLGWPTVCVFVSRIGWVTPLSHSGFRLGFPNFEFRISNFALLNPASSPPVSLSHQTTKFPPTPSKPSTSPRLIRMISTQVLYLDSNPIPCYHSSCFARKSTGHAPPKDSPPQISPLATHHSPLLLELLSLPLLAGNRNSLKIQLL